MAITVVDVIVIVLVLVRLLRLILIGERFCSIISKVWK